MRFIRLHSAFLIEFPPELSNKTFQQHGRHFHGHQYRPFRPFSAICDRYASSFGFSLVLNSWKSSWNNRELGSLKVSVDFRRKSRKFSRSWKFITEVGFSDFSIFPTALSNYMLAQSDGAYLIPDIIES